MPTLLFNLPRIGLALAVAGTLGLGYFLATQLPIDAERVYPALLVGFLVCDGSLWPSRSR